jgi:hypothetical protein
MKNTKIRATINIKIFQNKNIFLGSKYFCNTQIGLSTIKETKFHKAKNVPTIIGLLSCKRKKNTSVK